jgi:hypothetical protein
MENDFVAIEKILMIEHKVNLKFKVKIYNSLYVNCTYGFVFHQQRT